VPIILVRLWRSLSSRMRRGGWRLPLLIIGLAFVTSWVALALLEPDNKLVEPQNFFWWFIVTSSTVGYGDFFPVTGWGHVVGVYVIVSGIVSLTMLFTHLAAVVQTAKSKRMKGAIMTTCQGHIVVLGYYPDRTDGIIAQLALDDDRPIVLCASGEQASAHPLADQPQVQFVRGDLTSDDVLRRAGVNRARTVLVDLPSDDQALAVVVAVKAIAPQVHVVVGLQDLTRQRLFQLLSGSVECAQWHLPLLLCEAVSSPGLSQVYTDLLSSDGGANTYSLDLPTVPSGLTVGACQRWLGEHHNVTVLAVRDGEQQQVNPPWQTSLRAGMTLYYVATRPLRLTELEPLLRP
jgi:voltage-gated potassium channel